MGPPRSRGSNAIVYYIDAREKHSVISSGETIAKRTGFAATMSAVVLLVLVVAAIASMVPAIRAARVEPMNVLRDE
jgi:ABC-type lipoprotein release transport system permease subunit